MARSSLLCVLVVFAAAPTALGCTQDEPSAGAASAPGSNEQAPSVATPVRVQVGRVEQRSMPKLVTLLGNVMADQESEVAANVAGRVLSTPIERGQSVKVGEPLVMVDSKAANLSASASAAQAALADTQLAQANSDCQRIESLFAQGAVGQADFDRQHSQCKAQALQATAARAQAGLSSKLAADAIVRAPFSGVIGERYVNPGEYVQPQTRVASMYSIDPVRITISVPERGVSLVRMGAPIEVRVTAFPDRTFPATIAHISPALRIQQRDLLLEATAPNADGALRPGMFATVEASLGDEQLATVPADAVIAEGDVRRIFLARDGHAFEMVVRTGVTRDGRTAVYEDLPADAQVIRRPPTDLQDGVAIVTDDSVRSEITPEVLRGAPKQ